MQLMIQKLNLVQSNPDTTELGIYETYKVI